MHRKLQHLLHCLDLADHPDPWTGPTGKYYLSDKEATDQYLATCGFFPSKVAEALSKILGSAMLANIHGRSFLISEDYVEEKNNERIIRMGKDWILMESYSAVWQRVLRSRLMKDPDNPSSSSYWIETLNLLPGFRERFYEISEAEFSNMVKGISFDEDGFPIVTPPSEDVLRMAENVWRERSAFS